MYHYPTLIINRRLPVEPPDGGEGEALELGEIEVEGLSEADGLSDRLAELDGLSEAEGESERLALEEGERDREELAEGLSEAEALELGE